jgi:hypothetical protein
MVAGGDAATDDVGEDEDRPPTRSVLPSRQCAREAAVPEILAVDQNSISRSSGLEGERLAAESGGGRGGGKP